ncbi:MAG: molybdopterin molybdotransferase MoeA [Planctomycetota bacterium]|nr:molybdopterin molybdotransferase MoeA [Planctomycetota bacterium]MDA1112742.1 molybdopterin molybdotransferase MoeA [Planctomycetota bacterium]
MGTQSQTSQSSKGGDLLPYAEALQVLEGRLQSIGITQNLPLGECVGEVLAESIALDRIEPPVRRSAMDGFALMSDDGTQPREIVGTYFAGTAGQTPLHAGEAVAVMTGGTVPDGADAVIPIERTSREGNVLHIEEAVVPGQHVRRAGEMGEAGRILLKAGHRLRVPDLGAIAGCGYGTLKVSQKPKIIILSTGDEVVPFDGVPELHQVRDSNSLLSKVQLESFGANVVAQQHLLDEKAALRQGVGDALEQADLVVTIGGVSMGEKDYLPQVFSELGVEKLFHKMDIQPGKPVWAGEKDGHFVLGLPGNPISSFVVLELLGRLIVDRLAGSSAAHPRTMRTATLQGNVRSRRRPRYLPARFTDSPTPTVTPVQESGSGDWTSLAGAEVLLVLEANQTLSSGDVISYLPLECH